MRGTQISKLSDGGGGHSDLTHKQSTGYGYKLSALYENDHVLIGPYFHYWNIADSNLVPEIINGVPTGAYFIEPENNTKEIGLKLSKRF